MHFVNEFKKGDRILRMPDVLELVPYSRAHLYRLIEAGEFPRQIKCGRNRIGFLESEVLAWLSERVAARSNSNQ